MNRPIPEVMSVHGDLEVAEVAVLRFGSDRLAEVVDGLAPPLARRDKWVINVSTQFGCPVGCPFCDAAGPWRGNATAGEMLAQVAWALDRHPGVAPGCRRLKVHFARMGEPSLNDDVPAAIEALPGLAASPGLWACVATVAPRGRERWFEALRDAKERRFQGRFQLQFSVQSTDPAARARLVPVPHWPLEAIAGFGRAFHRDGDRKVVLNFALARGVPFDPGVVERAFEPASFAVKLTPVNPTARGRERGFATRLRAGPDPALDADVERLRGAGFDVVVSVGDGREDGVLSNCGQAVLALASVPG